MDKNEAVGVLKTLQDLNDSNYIKGALELSIKSLQSAESAQTDCTFIERSLLMVTIEHVRDICDKLNGNCHSCPFGSKDGCPFLSDDPMDWNVEYINERYSNSPLSKEDSGCLQL